MDGGVVTHDWIEKFGGAERVLEELVEVSKPKKVVTLWSSESTVASVSVQESWLAESRLRGRKLAALPLMPSFWRKLLSDEPDMRWVLSSSHLFAHMAGASRPDIKRISYVHTPARYLWEPQLDNRGSYLAQTAGRFLRRIDRKSASTLDMVIANSDFVKQRIERTWGVEVASVIHPPVDIQGLQASRLQELTLEEAEILVRVPPEGTYLVAVSRLVRYKGIEKALQAAEALHMQLVVIGDGPEMQKLRALGPILGGYTTFLGSVSEPLKARIIAGAVALLFPPVEDFGIVPVEAMALGTPVLTNTVGGATESVEPGVSGFHVDWSNFDELRWSIQAAEKLNELDIRSCAQRFDKSFFREKLALTLSELGL